MIVAILPLDSKLSSLHRAVKIMIFASRFKLLCGYSPLFAKCELPKSHSNHAGPYSGGSCMGFVVRTASFLVIFMSDHSGLNHLLVEQSLAQYVRNSYTKNSSTVDMIRSQTSICLARIWLEGR